MRNGRPILAGAVRHDAASSSPSARSSVRRAGRPAAIENTGARFRTSFPNSKSGILGLVMELTRSARRPTAPMPSLYVCGMRSKISLVFELIHSIGLSSGRDIV